MGHVPPDPPFLTLAAANPPLNVWLRACNNHQRTLFWCVSANNAPWIFAGGC